MEQDHKVAGAGTLDPSFGTGGEVDLASEAQPGNVPRSALSLSNNQTLYADKEGLSGRVIRLRRLNMNGAFDTNFGLNGTVSVSIGEDRNLESAELCHYPTDKWLLSGTYLKSGVQGVYVVRQHSNGDLDSSFNSTGILALDPLELIGTEQRISQSATGESAEHASQATSASARGIAVQPDGKIVLLYSFWWRGGINKAIVIRINQAGALDPTFNGSGYVFIELQGINYEMSTAERVEVQRDGKIVVLGTFDSSHESGSYVARFNGLGQLDPSFNNGRVVKIISPGPGPSRIKTGSLTIRESDGAIALVGTAISSSGYAGLIAVLNNSGSLHAGFNGGEVLLSNMLAEGVGWGDVVLQDEPQAIVVFGSGGTGDVNQNLSVVMARYHMNGTFDSSFNGRGWAVYKHNTGYASYRGMVATTGNKFMLCAYVYARPSTSTHGCLLRYLM